MGDLNTNTPTLRGSELLPLSTNKAILASPNIGMLQQFKAPSASVVPAVHLYMDRVTGAPGIGVELVDPSVGVDLEVTSEPFYVGTDAGIFNPFNVWETVLNNQLNMFDHLNDRFDVFNFVRNAVTFSYNTAYALRLRGNVTALTGKRVTQISVWASMRLSWPAFVSPRARVRGMLNIGGVDFISSLAQYVPANNRFGEYLIGNWDLNPATGLPWTLGEANAFIQTATAVDEFGLIVDQFSGAAEQLHINGLRMVINTALENRKGFLYRTGAVREGWDRYVLGTTSALVANNYYRLLAYGLKANAFETLQIPYVWDPYAVRAASAAATTGEHRRLDGVSLHTPSGAINGLLPAPDTSIMPHLIEVGGVVQSRSFPFAETGIHDVDTTYPVNTGQEITSDTAVPYAGVRLSVGWVDPGKKPDAPLTIEVRSTATGGTLFATARLDPDISQTHAFGLPFIVPFDSSWTPAAATKYFLHFKSSASVGKGWRIFFGDSRSDKIEAGSGTTVANVEGQTVNGTTDSYFQGGNPFDRYDIFIALVQAPAAPGALAATAKAGT